MLVGQEGLFTNSDRRLFLKMNNTVASPAILQDQLPECFNSCCKVAKEIEGVDTSQGGMKCQSSGTQIATSNDFNCSHRPSNSRVHHLENSASLSLSCD